MSQPESNVIPLVQPLPTLDRFRHWLSNQDKPTQRAILEAAEEIVAGKKLGSKEDAEEVLAFLNLKAGHKYRPVATNLNPIRRLLRTCTVQDMKAVIARRCRKWADDDRMAEFLRPKTLFNATNFENYLGEMGE